MVSSCSAFCYNATIPGSLRHCILLELSYGPNFSGVAVQPSVRTISGELMPVIEQTLGCRVRGVSFAARTDAGVQAKQNFVSFCVDDGAELPRRVSSLCDIDSWPDIAIRRAALLSRPIAARSCADEKRYVYRLHPTDTGGAVDWSASALDSRAMRRAASYLVGTHDFAAFRSKSCGAKTTTRTLMQLDVNSHTDGIDIVFVGDGFLRRMVRIIVGTLADVGRGIKAPESISEVLASRRRDLAGRTAPARGLCLEAVQLQLPAASWFDACQRHMPTQD